MSQHRWQKGFTMLELMTVILIAGILMAMAIPAFQTYQSNQLVRTTAQNLMSSLDLARSEAIKRRADVVITPITSGDWKDGWSVTVGTTTLSTFTAVNGAAITAASASPLTYNSDGRLTAAADAAFTVSVTGSTVESHCVKVTLSGKPTNRIGGC